jgi:acylphosphatase
MTRPAVRILVSGRVQGVGFRWWLVGQARGLDLCGWVRNLRDGRVEALAIGNAQSIERLTAACGRGPPGAAAFGGDRGGRRRRQRGLRAERDGLAP